MWHGGKARQSRAKQDKARQDKTRQGKARQDKTIQDKARQSKTRQDKTKQTKARQEKAGRRVGNYWNLSETTFENVTGIEHENVTYICTTREWLLHLHHETSGGV